MIIKTTKTSSKEGREVINRIRDRFELADDACRDEVAHIIHEVKTRGDEALLEYTRRFDAPGFTRDQIRVADREIEEAYREITPEFQESLNLAIDRIEAFHSREKADSWVVTRDDGAITGRLVNPVPSAGLYVPGGTGGKTPLVSSVLMNGIPAITAGVEHLVMVSPPNREGKIAPALLVAAQEIGIIEIYKAGSAWAIAALAYGTETIPRVDVIVGPGNRYVAEAKRQVSGRVRIDMLAGPSEVLIIADKTADPDFVAADLLSQAEHDPEAMAILITPEIKLARAVVVRLEEQLVSLDRKDIALKALADKGAIIITDDIEEAIALANEIAPEHLELMLHEPYQWLTKVKHAGAVFIGNYSPEAVGDYIAGPNHVLPTMGTARYASALGVETFLKKTSVISYSREAILSDAIHVERLAELEGLTAHARSVRRRVQQLEKG